MLFPVLSPKTTVELTVLKQAAVRRPKHQFLDLVKDTARKLGTTLLLFLFCISFYLAMLCAMWHLSSLTRNQTHALCNGSEEF